MNIRMGDGGIRFRISCEELAALLQGKMVEELLNLAGKAVQLAIDPSGEGGELSLIYEEGRISLKVSRDILQGLDQQGRKKEGAIHDMNGSPVSLQVDLKTYSRAKRG